MLPKVCAIGTRQPHSLVLPVLLLLLLCHAVGDVPLVWYKDEDHTGYDMQVGT
jgi:hypothetical protein